MKIYSYELIDEETLNKNHHFQNDLGVDVSFTINYDPRLVVNMNFKGQGQSNTNAQGWFRDRSTYFNELLVNHPDAFSERNKKLIKERRAPYCDKKFTDYFNEYKGYEGSKLVHHHIGRDGQAIALPQDLHVGTAGVHIAEDKVGIEDLTKNFSDKVQSDYDNEKKFDWENANDYYAKIAEERELLDAQLKYDQKNSEAKIEPNKTNIPNSKLECVKGDSVATEKETFNSSMSDDSSTTKKTIDCESKSKKIKGIKIKINPKSTKIWINFVKGSVIVIGVVGSAVFAAKNPEKVRKLVDSVVEIFQKSKPAIKMEEKAADIAENMDAEETFDKERLSPILHEVREYSRKDGTHINGYMRGKK